MNIQELIGLEKGSGMEKKILNMTCRDFGASVTGDSDTMLITWMAIMYVKVSLIMKAMTDAVMK